MKKTFFEFNAQPIGFTETDTGVLFRAKDIAVALQYQNDIPYRWRDEKVYLDHQAHISANTLVKVVYHARNLERRRIGFELLKQIKAEFPGAITDEVEASEEHAPIIEDDEDEYDTFDFLSHTDYEAKRKHARIEIELAEKRFELIGLEEKLSETRDLLTSLHSSIAAVKRRVFELSGVSL